MVMVEVCWWRNGGGDSGEVEEQHLRSGGGALVTTHGAYAAPPVRNRTLTLASPAAQEDAA